MMIVIRRVFALCLLLLLAACNLNEPNGTPLPPTLIPGTPFLVTAWAEAGNLYVWQTGDPFPRRVASGGVIQPFVSPDGAHIAFTRGPAGAPDTLWLVSTDGSLEQQLVGEGSPASYRSAQMGQVLWWDASTLYFNTLKRGTPDSTPKHDLYRANIVTRAVSLLLTPGEGGRITFSPSHTRIALVSAGDYGTQNGRIRVIDPLAQTPPTDLLYFIGAATGSHSGFYPPITWTQDESALIAAIPDKDLLYSEDKAEAPETALWRLPIEAPSDRETIGTLAVSFFGMPRWSDDGSHMLYLTRTDQNIFQITLADADGKNPFAIDSGAAGEIDMPQWIPGTTRFFYTRGAAGQLMTAALDELPHALRDEITLSPSFVTPEQMVFLAPQDNAYGVYTAALGQAKTLIGQTSGQVLFDAVWVTP